MTVARLIDLVPTKTAAERRQMKENALKLRDRGGRPAADADALLEALAAFEAEGTARRLHGSEGVDVVATVVAAFRQMPMSPTDQNLSRVLMETPGATSEDLTERVGWKDKAWQLHFGEMCKKREHLLWAAPFAAKRKAPFYCGILADFDEGTRGFTLKPGVAEAFAQLGLRARN